MVSIKDVASRCGFAVSTVSRAMNNHPDVSEDTRTKVMDAVRELHYIPNNSARNLVKSSSDTIMILVRGVSNPFFAPLIRVLEEELVKNGFALELHQIHTNEDELHAARLIINERKPCGILFLGGRFNYTQEEIDLIPVPFVMCTYANTFGSLPPSSYSSVSIDDRAAAFYAVNSLIMLGHKHIAILADSVCDRSISELRYLGYLDALSSAGIELDRELVINTDSFSDLGRIYDSVSSVIENDTKFTAIFCIADMMAIAAMKALTDHGISVPEDCSVLAIDGLDLTAYVNPVLCSLEQPIVEIGESCADTLIGLIEGRGQNRQILLTAKLRKGASVCAPLNLN